ncbi:MULTISPECIES: hypothetical protein [Corallococcus]|uniref:hypothetical protein n=1 Tax=Corallococcus TaxID=83461 RepID=UPI0011803A08|nr:MULTISPECIES: hypothetical protein [Corallococcus]NBD08985.1 hypothetical protein [Corallococcus silvisoli]TSC32922.1 hypothetical protein FOF48_07980 [Corallococcus sp. Z5C101001]
MKKVLIGLAAMASLTACGSSVCEKIKDGVNKVTSQAKACGFVQEDPDDTGEYTDAQEKLCESAMERCSDSEKKMLEDFADCVNDIPACKSASEAELDAMGVKYNKCGVDHLQGISEACFRVRAE